MHILISTFGGVLNISTSNEIMWKTKGTLKICRNNEPQSIKISKILCKLVTYSVKNGHEKLNYTHKMILLFFIYSYM